MGEFVGSGAAGCRIGVWGAFDTGTIADALAGQVLRRELGARLPGGSVRLFAPSGSDRPSPRDGGEPAEPLGAWSPERESDVTADLDLVVLACPDQTDPDPWFGEPAGPPGGPTVGTHRIRLRSDPTILAPRLFSPDLLAKRLEYLWLMGWYPSEGAAVVVEGDAGVAGIAPALAAALSRFLTGRPDLRVVVAEMGAPGDADFAATLAAALPDESVYRLPGFAGVEDVAAAVANCAAFAGSSPAGGLLALAYGRRPIRLEASDPPGAAAFEAALKAEGSPREAQALTDRADAELDAVAAMARQAAAARTSSEEAGVQARGIDETRRGALERLQVAHEARSRRLATERMVFANHLHKAEKEIARLKAETARLREELSQASDRMVAAGEAIRSEAAARQAVEEELARLRATRTFRYTAEMRSVYGRLRRMAEAPEVAPEGPPGP